VKLYELGYVVRLFELFYGTARHLGRALNRSLYWIT
jgi:hypothetical protein